VALPVFPSRVFRHGYIYVNRKAGIRSPKDIAGKRVGVPLYTMTAAVWIRGILRHHYDVDFSAVRWTEGAINHPGRHGEPSAPPLLKPVEIAHDPKGRSLSELLANHEIDVIMGTQHPDPHPDIMPLFVNARAVERAFYEQTRIFPIMHLVVIRREVYERDRAIADKLYRGFVEAKALALKRMHKGHPFMLPWVHNDIHEIDAVFAGDPMPTGSRPTTDAGRAGAIHGRAALHSQGDAARRAVRAGGQDVALNESRSVPLERDLLSDQSTDDIQRGRAPAPRCSRHSRN